MRNPAVDTAADDLLDLVIRLVAAQDRRPAARALARALGGEDLVVLVRDAEVRALVPAAGFPQTLRGNEEWRALLLACAAGGRYESEVQLPEGVRRRAAATSCQGLVVVLLGAGAGASLAELERYLPLLAFAFAAEQQARLAEAQAGEARQAASRAQELARALELARADVSALNAELRAEQQRKDDFLAMLAHELRNPLSPLVTSLDLLRLAAPEAPALRERIEVMTRHTRQLSQLVDDLLDVSRVSRGRIELRRKQIELSEVLREALEANQTALQVRGHGVELALAGEPIRVDADRVRLTQVFSNLIHNAAKYTPPGGRIRVTSRRDDVHAIVNVEDNGAGIERAALPHIFGLFHQADTGVGRAHGGLGIGLTLARLLVELHGGRIEAQSAGPGNGSTFSVWLPLAAAAKAAPASKPPEAQATRPLRVLVVDDNQDAADVTATVLGVLGHRAEVAYSSAAALQRAGDIDPELVLLDIGLPDLDGYELARRLRRALSPAAYLVALTGYGGEEHMRRAGDAGFDDHLTKPASLEALQRVAARAASSVREAHSR